jgi:hypothetical protein
MSIGRSHHRLDKRRSSVRDRRPRHGPECGHVKLGGKGTALAEWFTMARRDGVRPDCCRHLHPGRDGRITPWAALVRWPMLAARKTASSNKALRSSCLIGVDLDQPRPIDRQ